MKMTPEEMTEKIVEKDKEIAELKEKIKILEEENELLRDDLGNKIGG